MLERKKTGNFWFIKIPINSKDIERILNIAHSIESWYSNYFLDLLEQSAFKLTEFWFGGTGGTQFPTKDSAYSFYEVFTENLEQHGIPSNLSGSILYVITMAEQKHERQYSSMFDNNYLVETAILIKDFFINYNRPFFELKRRKDYQVLEKTFSSIVLVVKDSPPVKIDDKKRIAELSDAGKVFIFKRTKLLNLNVYIPYDFEISFLTSLGQFSDTSLNNQILIKRSNTAKQHILINWIKQLLKEHKFAKTSFYLKLSKTKELRDIDFIEIPQKRNYYKLNQTLEFIGGILQTYLQQNIPGRSKPKIAKFIKDYLVEISLKLTT